MKNDELRKQARMVKAIDKEWSYKNMAELIEITPSAFYNWLSGAYELSAEKEKELRDFINNILFS